MRRRGLTGDFWPTPEQELLLRAAVLEPQQALEAWLAVRPRIDIDRLEEGSFALLPLIVKRLRLAEVEDRALGKLRGVYRHTWSRNQLAVGELKAILRVLHGTRIDAAPLRGVAALLAYYSDRGVRPVTELEVLVPEESADRALETLGAAGWSPADAEREPVAEGWPGLRLRSTSGRTAVVHWRLLPEFDPDGRWSGELWRSTRDFDVDGVPTRLLRPEDELLHTTLTGARSAPFTTVQWIVDTTTILQAVPEFDWDRLVEQAERRRAVLRLRDALTYLSTSLDTPVPARVLSRLHAQNPTRRDQVAHKIGAWGGKTAGEFPRALAQYVRSTAGDGAFRTAVGAPAFLRDTWKLDHTWQVPLHAAKKSLSRIAARGRQTRSA